MIRLANSTALIRPRFCPPYRESPQSMFVNFIALVQGNSNDAAQTKSENVWTLGVGAHLALLKYRLLLEEKDMVNSFSLVDLLDHLEKYIKFSETSDTWKYFDWFPTPQDRIDNISDVSYENWNATSGGYFFKDTGMYWNEPSVASDYVAGGEEDSGIFGQNHHEGAARDERKAYVELKNAEWFDYAQKVQVFDKWREMYRKYAEFSNTGSGAKRNADQFPPSSAGPALKRAQKIFSFSS